MITLHLLVDSAHKKTYLFHTKKEKERHKELKDYWYI